MIPKYRRPNEIDHIIESNDIDWKPLIVVGEIDFGSFNKSNQCDIFIFTANSKSGDNTASDVLAAFRSILNPIQVFELSSHGPGSALNLLSKIHKICRVLVAGGDGTVGWISTEISKKQISPLPEVCIMPIGTGNDLSRVLGWGAVPPDVLNPFEMCTKVYFRKDYEFILN